MEKKGKDSSKKYLMFPVIGIVLLVLVILLPKPKKENNTEKISIEKPKTQQPLSEPQHQQPDNLKTLGKNVSLRENPEGKIIEELKKGSKVEIIDATSFPWIKVKYKEKEGYIYTCNIFINNQKATNKNSKETERSMVNVEQNIDKKEEEKEEKEEEKEKSIIDIQRLSIVCSKKGCVLYDKGTAYNVGDIWRGYVIRNISVFSIEVEKDGKIQIISLE